MWFVSLGITGVVVGVALDLRFMRFACTRLILEFVVDVVLDFIVEAISEALGS